MARSIKEWREYLEKDRQETRNRTLGDAERRKIAKKEYYNKFLDESYDFGERLSVQGSTKRGIAHSSGSKEGKRMTAEIVPQSKAAKPSSVQQFGACTIRSNVELERLHSAGEGLIYNDFSRGGASGKDYNVLHAASCRWVARSDVNVPKYYFSSLSEATKWLRANRGGEGENWKRCGTCQAKSHSVPRFLHESKLLAARAAIENTPAKRGGFTEAEAERILVQYLKDNGYNIRRQVREASGIIDIVANGPSGNWSIEVKGEDRGGYTSAEMNFQMGLGQLMSRMKQYEVKYGLAFPLTEDFIRVLRKYRDSHAFEKLGIYIIPVKKDGSCRLVSPSDFSRFLEEVT